MEALTHPSASEVLTARAALDHAFFATAAFSAFFVPVFAFWFELGAA